MGKPRVASDIAWPAPSVSPSPVATPAVAPAAIVDQTGCGDAWRAALLFGLEQDWPLVRCAELGNRMGALKIAQRGPQNYEVDRAALGL